MFFFYSTIAFSIAQPPQVINYQGITRNAQGFPLLNRNIAIRLSILDSSATGQPVYVESHITITSSSGLFNLSIGSRTIINGTFSAIPWGQGNKWLRVEMDTSGGSNFQLLGVTQFLSVPYALNAANGNKPGVVLGDMQYWNGIEWVRVPAGSHGQSLFFCNGVPTWGGCLPLLITTSFSFPTSILTIGGNISNDGGSSITARGVCWSTSSSPTTTNNKTMEGTGIGTYISSIAVFLMANTTYYVRAYATNSVGTSYGNEISFTTFSSANLPSVTICNQIWATQNLSESTYRNGDPIPRVDDPNLWASLTSGAYCYYNNDSATYAAIYGKLYNWYAVNDPRGLAPIGWHLPSDSEWISMISCLGGSSVAGGKMKETGNSHWSNPNLDATNTSGFTGLPGSFRNYIGNFGGFIGGYSYYWSKTESNATNANEYNLTYQNGIIYFQNDDKKSGYSVRCLRD